MADMGRKEAAEKWGVTQEAVQKMVPVGKNITITYSRQKGVAMAHREERATAN